MSTHTDPRIAIFDRVIETRDALDRARDEYNRITGSYATNPGEIDHANNAVKHAQIAYCDAMDALDPADADAFAMYRFGLRLARPE